MLGCIFGVCRVHECICELIVASQTLCVVLKYNSKQRIVWVSQHPVVCFPSGPESDPGFSGGREHWHQTLPGELSCHSHSAHTDTYAAHMQVYLKVESMILGDWCNTFVKHIDTQKCSGSLKICCQSARWRQTTVGDCRKAYSWCCSLDSTIFVSAVAMYICGFWRGGASEAAIRVGCIYVSV